MANLTDKEVDALNALWAQLSQRANHYVPSIQLGSVLADLQASSGVTDPLPVDQIQASTSGGPFTIATSDAVPYVALVEDDQVTDEPTFISQVDDFILKTKDGGSLFFIDE